MRVSLKMPKEELGETELFNSGTKARKTPSDHEKNKNKDQVESTSESPI